MNKRKELKVRINPEFKKTIDEIVEMKQTTLQMFVLDAIFKAYLENKEDLMVYQSYKTLEPLNYNDFCEYFGYENEEK